MADKPVTREEKYLAYLTGDYKGEIPKPITRKEKYLYELCLKGIGGEISPEEIKAAVNEYLEKNGKLVKMVDSSKLDNTQSIVNKTEWLLAEPQETDLTTEEITAFKALATYYPVTNISINSEQLDGYTVFNYPISMKNGWDYVKQQLNDNRDYIYDMDIQSAEAYVNSEYAVALTELEV